MTAGTAAARRAHPPDRRHPVWVDARRCPMGFSCGCCMGPEGLGHFIPARDGQPSKQIRDCRMPHPPIGRECKLPVPADPPACPEREFLAQLTPAAPVGRCCIECGRVTARLYVGDALPWAKGVPLPWCAGGPPNANESKEAKEQ